MIAQDVDILIRISPIRNAFLSGNTLNVILPKMYRIEWNRRAKYPTLSANDDSPSSSLKSVWVENLSFISIILQK